MTSSSKYRSKMAVGDIKFSKKLLEGESVNVVGCKSFFCQEREVASGLSNRNVFSSVSLSKFDKSWSLTSVLAVTASSSALANLSCLQ